MFYSYLFDNIPGELDEGLPNHEGFLMLSQGGFLRCIEKSAPIKPMVIAHLEHRIIHGDRHSGIHYFLTATLLEAGQDSVQALQKKLADHVKPGSATYTSLLIAQRVINSHFEQAIANLVDTITDDDYVLNARLFSQIADNYTVLAKFNPQRYMQESVDWRRKSASYRRAFCKEKELVTVTLQ